MKNLLILLGRRVHDLRVAKKWSQEEFADVSGLHRTYVGQIERGEKNISFNNLVKIASVLDVTTSELLTAIDIGHDGREPSSVTPSPRSRRDKAADLAGRLREIEKLLRRLHVQRTAISRTVDALDVLACVTNTLARRSVNRTSEGDRRRAKKRSL